MDNRERKGMDKVCGDQLFFCSWSRLLTCMLSGEASSIDGFKTHAE
jgi:hypothetical protein